MTPLTDTPWKTPLHAKYRFTTSIFLVVGNFWLINCKKTSVVKKHQRESIFLRNYTILLTAICWCFNVPTSWLPISFYFLPKVIRCPRPHPHPCTDTVKDDWDELMLHCNFVKPYWIPAKLNFQSVKFVIEMVNAACDSEFAGCAPTKLKPWLGTFMSKYVSSNTDICSGYSMARLCPRQS